MAAQGIEERRIDERRTDERRGTLPDINLAEIGEENAPAEQEREFKGSDLRVGERRTSIKRNVDRELHDLLTA